MIASAEHRNLSIGNCCVSTAQESFKEFLEESNTLISQKIRVRREWNQNSPQLDDGSWHEVLISNWGLHIHVWIGWACMFMHFCALRVLNVQHAWMYRIKILLKIENQRIRRWWRNKVLCYTVTRMYTCPCL